MKRVLQVMLMTWLAAFLASCGVRGDLDEPPGSEPKKDEPIILDQII